jgi:hypothetical protein
MRLSHYSLTMTVSSQEDIQQLAITTTLTNFPFFKSVSHVFGVHQLSETTMIKICPVCTSEGIDSLPISPNEAYTYDISESAGLSLSFKSFNSRGERLSVREWKRESGIVNVGIAPPITQGDSPITGRETAT